MNIANEPQVVPSAYSGLWIAWNRERTEVIASGRTLHEAAEAAATAGEIHPLFAKVPKNAFRFAGRHQ